MNIFLDDTRTPEQVSWLKLPQLNEGESWHIARSVQEFCDLLDMCDRTDMAPTRVCFDHDLADEHYGDLNCNEGTGQEAAKALVQLLVTREWPMPEYVIHTMNPIGEQKIRAILEIDFLKMRDMGRYEETVPEPYDELIHRTAEKAKKAPVKKGTKANNGLAESEVFTNPDSHSAMKVVPAKKERKPKAK